MAKKQARILVDHSIGEMKLKAGHIVQGSSSAISGLEKGGIVDLNKDAVAYARSQEGCQQFDIGGEDPAPSSPPPPPPPPAS